MSHSLENEVIEAVAAVKRRAPGEIDLNTTFEALDIDSLDAIEILHEIEERMDVVILDAVLEERLESVGDVVEVIRRHR